MYKTNYWNTVIWYWKDSTGVNHSCHIDPIKAANTILEDCLDPVEAMAAVHSAFDAMQYQRLQNAGYNYGAEIDAVCSNLDHAVWTEHGLQESAEIVADWNQHKLYNRQYPDETWLDYLLDDVLDNELDIAGMDDYHIVWCGR